jgi:hypothetical protein
MAAIDMTELQYAARGRSVVPGAPIGGVPPHILGMTSTVRGSIRKVHFESPAAAMSHANAVLGRWLAGASSPNPGHRASATAAQNYIDCISQYVSWDASSGLTFRQWQLQGVVTYTPTDTVDALVRVVLADSAGQICGRVVLWDTEPITAPVADVISAVAIEVLDTAYGAANVGAVDIWQIRDGVQHNVSAAAARAARPTAAALVRSI